MMSRGIQQVRERIILECESAKSWVRNNECEWCEYEAEYLSGVQGACRARDGKALSWPTRTMGEALAVLAFAGYLNAKAQAHAYKKHDSKTAGYTWGKVVA